MSTKRMSGIGRATLIFSIVLMTGAFNGYAQASYRILHNFTGSDGAFPTGSLTLSGSMLYGTTSLGGAGGCGTIFRIGTNGAGFQLLHSFEGADCASPPGSLVLAGSTLYGMINDIDDLGLIYKIGTDGSGFQLLHNFQGTPDDGAMPYGSLVISGATLYGMTPAGGTSDSGTIFRVNTDGGGFEIMHHFAGGASDGAMPYGALILSGSTLYGMTYSGGVHDEGTIFSINTNSSGFQILHSFAGGLSDGAGPVASLTLSGSMLYGMTEMGGAGFPDDGGTIFKINTDGSEYQVLHSFKECANNGFFPEGSLTQVGSKLYGTTYAGGSGCLGTIFRINMDGTGFQLFHSFPGAPNDGILPYCSLTLSGTKLYGMTFSGVLETSAGVIFSADTINSLTPAVELLLLR